MAGKRNDPLPHSSESSINSGTSTHVITVQIIQELETACQSSSNASLFKKKIKACLSILDEYPVEKHDFIVLELLNTEIFSEVLDKLILQTFLSEFTNRDYFSYDESDFEGHSDKTKCVIEFLVKLLCGFKSSGDEITLQPYDLSKGFNDWDGDEEIKGGSVVCQKLSSHLPHLVLMVAGNARNSPWSSQTCKELGLKLIQVIFRLYGCENLSDILALRIKASIKDYISFNNADKSLLSYLLHKFEGPLSRERWERNPYLNEAFSWLTMHLTSSQLSVHMNQILAVALNFLHNFDANYKLKGLQLLTHLIDTGSNEEIRLYNRAEVIYEALKTQIYTKEIGVLYCVIGCIFSVLKILEKSQDVMVRHNFILSTLLTNAEAENLLALRQIYISRLAEFVLCCDVTCIAHLGRILKVIECYLEVDDGPEELARISALDVLQNVLKVAWPRIPFHSETILKFLLKFIININSPSFIQIKGKSLKEKLEQKIINCLLLLRKMNPSIRTCLEVLKRESDHQGYLDSVLNALPEVTIDTCT